MTQVASPATPTKSRRCDTDALFRALRAVTWVLFVATAVMAMNVGVRQASYTELQSGIVTGEISQVVVQGAMGGPDGMGTAVGTATVRLAWNDGTENVVEIQQVSSRDELGQSSHTDTQAIIVGAVDPELRRLNPDVQIARSDWRTGAWVTVGGRQVYGLWALLPAVLLVQFLLLVMVPRKPRFATRMGWFWLTLTPLAPVVIPAFLIAGWKGQVTSEPRLNGIWSFVIAVIVIPLVWL